MKTWSQLTELQKDALRSVGVLVVVGGLGTFAYFFGMPYWRRWQGHRAIAQAEAFAQKRDYRNLLLALRRATEQAPADAATWEEVARILAEIGSPAAVTAQEQVAKLEPQDLTLRLALVQDALRFGRYDTAQATLAQLDAAAWRDVAFHRLAAAVALALGHEADLKSHLEAMIAANPRDLDTRFTYAALRAWSEDPGVASAAARELEALLAEPAVRVRAAIELLAATAHQRDPARVQEVLARLLAVFAPGTAPDFSRANPPAWNALLQGMKAASAPAPRDAVLVGRWLSDLGRRPEAIAWLENLPPPSRDAPVVLDLEAELAAEDGGLSRFEGLLRRGAWGTLPFDAITLALAAHVQRLHFDEVRSQATWGDAVAACGDSVAGLRALARMAIAWREAEGAERALQAILDHDPKAFWAYTALRNSYAARHDLRDLWQLYGRWEQQLPQDPEITAQWIRLACILNLATPEICARAEALHAAAPESAAAEVAYVASLWRQGRLDQAWAELSALLPAERLQPRNAFWIALVQAGRDRKAEAAAALGQAFRLKMGAEELDLLRKAAEKIGYSGAIPGRSG